MLSLAGVVQADDRIWTDTSFDHLWSTAENWNGGLVPTSADAVKIRMLPGPTIANEGAVAQGVYIGTGTDGALTVDGGTLAAKWVTVAEGLGLVGTSL